MKNILSFCLICFCVLVSGAYIQTKSSSNLPTKDVLPSVVLSSSSVFGEYEGRIPCQEIGRELNMKVSAVCEKRKIALTLYHDSVSLIPTTYKLRGMGEKSGGGKWNIIKGTLNNMKAIFYQLDIGDKHLLLYKGDDNVLFFLDKNKNFLPGNAKYSYTLNRIRNSKSWENWRYLANRGESF